MHLDTEELKKWFKWIAGSAVVIGLSAGFGVLSVMYFQVYFGDDSHLKKTTILAKINEETSIYYLDEETRIGSFFDEQHRRYVPIDEVPAHMINSLIASEDKYFYDHGGVNPIAIAKAVLEGLKLAVQTNFRVIHFRGGSTITQQTVKNILDKREYSLSRKFTEAIAAMQLERLYNKRQILEFYLNQFHITANGNGIGIGAQYYFNKDVRDLNLVEAAFIAGSVKAPSKYNPFIKYTPEDRKQAWGYANERKNYVLKRMYEQGWINEQEFREAWDQPVPFQKGKFTSKEVALVSLVRGQLEKKEILDELNMSSIDELNHAGLKIFTTLDADIQKSAQLMMRRNLSRLETILQGYQPEDESHFRQLRDLEVNEFYYGKVEKIVNVGGKPRVLLDFGLPKGTIQYDSLLRYAKLIDIPAQKGGNVRLKELIEGIKVGDVLFVEVREYDVSTHQAVVELHKRPLVNGAMVVLDRGEMRAVVSGFDPQGYNRAIFGKRQPGSVFKSVVFFAALQLGWSILDRLDNERRVFPYQGQYYYPQPDHASPYKDVSMIWAGTKSENLASIYLTSHLVDKLSLEQFTALLKKMELLPTEGESRRDFHYRVARATGVQLDNEGIKEFELANAINDLSPDLVFSGQQSLLNTLDKMWWGRGYAAEMQRLYVLDEEEYSDKEQNNRIALIKNNYARHMILATHLESDWERISQAVESSGAEGVFADEELQLILRRFRVIPGQGNRPGLGYFRALEEEEPKNESEVTVVLESDPGRALNSLDVQAIWGKAGLFTSSANLTIADVQISGFLPLAMFRKLQRRLEERYEAVMAIDEPYDLPRYYHHHDFRIAIGLKYLQMLCKEMGVFSKIEPVLSFALGTNVVSVAEVAKIYQTFIDGKLYRFYKEGPINQLNFIRRIEDRFGNVLYEPERLEHQLVIPEYAQQMRQILRKVITHGTGGRARGELYLKLGLDPENKNVVPIRIPAFGKTGTTNDYRTASFAGFLPYPVSKRANLDPRNSYVLAAYAGYDFNREMRNGGFKVSGAQGALPPWTDLAKEIIDKKDYLDYLDKLDIKIISRQEWPLRFDAETIPMRVDLPRGLVLNKDNSVESEMFATTDIGVTGEEYVNEFALTSSVKSYVRVPPGRGNTNLPLMIVSPFAEWRDEEDDGMDGLTFSGTEEEFPSTVEPEAMRKLPGVDDVTVNQGTTEFENPPVVERPKRQRLRRKPKRVEPEAPLDRGWKSVREKPDIPNDPPPPQTRPAQRELIPKQQDQPPIPNEEDDPGFIEEELW